MSLAILAKPHVSASTHINGEAVVLLKDGTSKYLAGNRELPKYGGLLLLTARDTTPLSVSDIQTVTFKFSAAVDIGFAVKQSESEPAILWMGR